MSETNVATLDGVALEDRLVSSAIGALELYSIYLGRELGLYRALTARALTYGELAEAAGVNARYAREWLEQQAVAGFLHMEDETATGAQRRYRIDPDRVGVFVQEDHPSHVSPLAAMVVGVGQTLDQVADAYLTGGGVPFAAYGKAMRTGQGGVNRPAFTHDLVPTWIGSVDGLADRIRTGRIADLGCGVGWSTIAMAQGFPQAEVVGWDTDLDSIGDARRHAQDAGIELRFEAADASALAEDGPYDLVTVLEALHDMAQPAAVLSAARAALGEGGVVLVADEKVADRFAGPGDEMERMMYGWSVTHCLPAAMAERPSAALGTVIRESTVRELAAQAGFTRVETLDEVDAGFFRLYVLS